MRTVEELIASAQRQVGRVLDDKFRLVACIGIGGSGAVYRAEQIALHRTVAIKLLNEELNSDERLVRRFRDEATAASSLNHPNTASIIDFGQTPDGLLYLAMEYVKGPTLTQLVQSNKELSVGRVLDIIAQVLAGIEEAHTVGIVHADLKCDNVIVDQRRAGVDMVKVVDFGIARLANAPREGDDKSIAGTPEYMAPEVIRGQAPGFAADQYAIGIMLYELLTGSTPYFSTNTVEVLTSHLKLELPALASKRAQLQNPALEGIVARALAKEVSARFPTVGEMRSAIVAEQGRLASVGREACPSCGTGYAATAKFCMECGLPRSKMSRQISVAKPRPEQKPLPFVGFEAELDDVVAYLRGETSSAAPLVIAGEPGAGKTALIAQAISATAKLGLTVYHIDADPTLVERPLHPIRQLFACILGVGEMPALAEVEAAALSAGVSLRDVPGLAFTFGHRGNLAALEPPVRRRELIAATKHLLSAVGSRQPAVIVFDNVDSYDDSTLELIREVYASANDASELPMAILAATPQLAAQLSRAAVRLSPMSQAMVEQLVEVAQLPLAADELYNISQGRPGLLDHLVRFAAAGGSISEAGYAYPDVIAARLAVVPQAVLNLLQAISIFGLQASTTEAAQLGGSLAAAPEAIMLGLLQQRGELLRFSSETVRDIVYASTPADVRRRGHVKAAALVASAGPTAAPALLGYHHEHGGQAVAAIVPLMTAAEQGLTMLDARGSADLYQRALIAVRQSIRSGDGIDDTPQLFVKISLALATLLKERGESALARGVLAEAGAWVSKPGEQIAITKEQASISIFEGDVDTAVAMLRKGIGRAMAAGEMELLCELYIALANALLRQSKLDDARRELGECVDLVTMGEGAAATAGPRTLWQVFRLKSQLSLTLGDSHRALALGEAALRHANRVKDPLAVARVTSMLASASEKSGFADKAAHYRQAAIVAMRKLGDRRSTAELLLAEAPARALISASDKDRVREASQLAIEIGWREGQLRAEDLTD